MIDKTLTIGDVTLTIRRATVRHRIVRQIIIRKLYEALQAEGGMDDITENLAYQFASFIAQTEFRGWAAWVCSASDDSASIYGAMWAFAELDADVFDALRDAIAEVNAPAVTDEKKALMT